MQQVQEYCKIIADQCIQHKDVLVGMFGGLAYALTLYVNGERAGILKIIAQIVVAGIISWLAGRILEPSPELSSGMRDAMIGIAGIISVPLVNIVSKKAPFVIEEYINRVVGKKNSIDEK